MLFGNNVTNFFPSWTHLLLSKQQQSRAGMLQKKTNCVCVPLFNVSLFNVLFFNASLMVLLKVEEVYKESNWILGENLYLRRLHCSFSNGLEKYSKTYNKNVHKT